MHFAREGADVAIVFRKSDEDAAETKRLVELEGRRCLMLKGDVANESFCKDCVAKTFSAFDRLDILVNNAGTHEEDYEVEEISKEQWHRTFEVNAYSFFYFTQAALRHLPEKTRCIINTASVVAYRGSYHLMDYATT